MIEEVVLVDNTHIHPFSCLDDDSTDSGSDAGTDKGQNHSVAAVAAFNMPTNATARPAALRKTIGGIIFTPVDEVTFESMSPGVFRDCYRMRRPVIVKAGAATWCACSSWADPVEFMSKVTPNSGVTLVSKDNSNFLLHELCDVNAVSLHDSIRQILLPQLSSSTSSSISKLYSRMYLDSHPQLYDDVNFSNIADCMSAALPTSATNCDGECITTDDGSTSNSSDSSTSSRTSIKLSNCGVWVSSKDCVTPLHYDICHGFLCQIVGKKTFLLAAPGDTNYLYRNTSITTKNQTSSRVDLSAWLRGDGEQRKRCPNISEVVWYIAELSPGDILYTPPGWWHHVTSIDPSISVLVPFDPATNESLCVLQSV